MTKECKVWCCICLIANIISAIIGLIVLQPNSEQGIFISIVGLVGACGFALLLIQQYGGVFLIAGVNIIGVVDGFINGTGIMFVMSAVITGITCYFIDKQDIIQIISSIK